MSTVPAPASTAEALAVLGSAMNFLAAADPTAMSPHTPAGRTPSP